MTTMASLFNAHRVDIPLVLFVDLQAEYIAAGRAYALDGIDACLENCAILLSECRRQRLPIVHFRTVRPDVYFNGASPFANWIPDFRPRTSEMVFERERPSCYSSAEFSQFVANIHSPQIILAGLTAEHACLSTAVDLFHRRHVGTFVADASASRPIGNMTAQQAHAAAATLISQFADVVSTRDVLSRLSILSPCE